MFKIYKNEFGYYCALTATNGKILLTSSTYATKRGVKDCIDAIKSYAQLGIDVKDLTTNIE